MTQAPTPICYRCQYFKVPPLKTKGLTCRAFPDGIPEDIILTGTSHIDPLPGDNGFQYKELTGNKLKKRQKAIREWIRG